jgi:LytS/YehU family sensor histidine kinase
VLLDILVFTVGMGYRIRDYYRDQLKLKSEVFKKNDEINLLNLEKTQLKLSVLQAQMNPHFVFNSLNSINRFILKDQNNYASDYLTKFAKLLRFILDNTTNQEITLTNEINYLKLYLELESIRFNGKFNFKINIANNINTDNYYFPPLILQPIAENSIKHGFVKKDRDFVIILNISFEEPYLFIELSDNGIGITEAAKLRQKSMILYESKGLAIVKERLSKYMMFKEKIIEYSIHEVFKQDGSSGGTKTIIKIEN